MKTMTTLSVATRLKLAYPTLSPVPQQHQQRLTFWRSRTTCPASSRQQLFDVVSVGSRHVSGRLLACPRTFTWRRL